MTFLSLVITKQYKCKAMLMFPQEPRITGLQCKLNKVHINTHRLMVFINDFQKKNKS